MRRNTDDRQQFRSPRALIATLAIVPTVALASVIGLLFPDTFDYQRAAMLDDFQWWRLATAHMVHLNAWHALMNLAALGLVLALLHDAASAWQWCAAYLGISLLVSLALLASDPGLQRYAGASGVIHGLIAFGALRCWHGSRLESALLLSGLAMKLGYEAHFGASATSESLIGAAVITEAHLYGALAGMLVAVSGAIAAGFHRA